MKRLFLRAVPEALLVFWLVGAGCSPENKVKPGAPVLTMLSIVEPSGNRTDVTSDATMCATGVKEGDSCDPMADPLCQTTDSDWCKCVATEEPPPPEEPPCSDTQDAGTVAEAGAEAGTDAVAEAGIDAAVDAGLDAVAAEAGTDAATDAVAAEAGEAGAAAEAGAGTDAGSSTDAAAGETAAPKGTWQCPRFSTQSRVIATFDRILDTAPLGDNDGTTRTDLATLTTKPAVMPAPTTSTDYSPNGSTGGLIFGLFGENPGPNLQVSAVPALPTDNTVTVALSRSRIRAKDGTTVFTSSGLIVDGVLTFRTGGFSADVAVPPPAPPPPPPADDAGTDAGAPDAAEGGGSDAAASDASASDACVPPPPPPPEPTEAAPDMTPVTITFSNPVDPDMIASHIHITAGGVAYDDQVTIDTSMSPVVTVTPKTTWAASKTFVVTVDDTAADVFGAKLDGGAMGSFTTAAM